MLKFAVLIVGICCIAAVQSKYTWKCPSVDKLVKVDPGQMKGEWFVFGVNPSRWSMCYNYTITDADNEFKATETYFRTLIHTKATTEYDLVFSDSIDEITLKHKVWKFLPSSTTWKIVGASMENEQSWVVLYRCSLFKESSEIWVKNPQLYKDNGDIAKQVESALSSIGFQISDYQLRQKSDCNH